MQYCYIDTIICMPRVGNVQEGSGQNWNFLRFVDKTVMMESEVIVLFSLRL